MHVMSDFSAAVHNELSPLNAQTMPMRGSRIAGCLCPETTFEVHGDACLHADIVTCMLSPFMSSTMAHLETPYQLAASSFPDQVNDMVRPLLRTSVRTELGRSARISPQDARCHSVLAC